MRMGILAATALVLGVGTPGLAAAQGSGQLVERTLAIVAGRAVTLSDARTARALGFIDTADVESSATALVERALMLREVDRYAPPEPLEAEVTRAIDELRARLTAEQLTRILAEGGFTEARLRAWIRDDLRIAAYLDQRFSAAADLSVASTTPELRERQSAQRRANLIADWLTDLRRRTPVVELWRRP